MNQRIFPIFCTALGAVLLLSWPVRADAPKTKKAIPVLLDTDIGSDIDDAFALALIFASPEVELCGVTTVGRDPRTRAQIACRMLMAADRRDIPVAAGAPPQPDEEIEKQGRYVRDLTARSELTTKPVKESAAELLYRQLKSRPRELTILAIGPLTNIARLLREHPDCKPWIKRLVLMGGSVRIGYKDKSPPEPEWNIKLDVPAAQTVFTSGVPLVVAPLDATAMLKLKEPLRRRLFAAKKPLTESLHALYRLWGEATPTLFDPVAAMLCFDERFCTMERLRLQVDDKGMTREVKGEANARVATAIRGEEFLRWYVERVASFGETRSP